MRTGWLTATDDRNTGFAGFLASLLDGGEFTVIPFLLGVAGGAATGWQLAVAYLPGAEYICAAVGAILGIFLGIALATGLVGLLLGWAVGWLAAWVVRSAFGVDSDLIVLVPKYAGAALGVVAGILCTVVAVTNSVQRRRHRG